jgi:hypothetical protein
MLNPSTADAEVDDPPIRRCMGFSPSWVAGGICVANLFALRSTDPAMLYQCADPVGPKYNETIGIATAGRRVIVAWGYHGAHLQRDRAVLTLLSDRMVEALAVTKDGYPKHPLYVAGSTVPRTDELRINDG